MAEILIQRRRHRNVWPWLLGLLALALLPLPFMAADRDDRRASRGATTRRATPTRSDTTATRADSAAVPGAQTAPGVGRGGATAARATSGARPVAEAARSGERTTQSVAGAVVPAPSTSGPGASAPATGAAGSPTAAASASSTSFERFIATSNPRANDREYREFTSDALRRLATELSALGASSAGVRAITANADSLRMTNTRGGADPDHARAAFLAAVRELDVLRARYRTPVDTGALRAAAWAVRPDQRLLAQRSIIQTFFQRARDALHVISRSRSSLRAPDRRPR